MRGAEERPGLPAARGWTASRPRRDLRHRPGRGASGSARRRRGRAVLRREVRLRGHSVSEAISKPILVVKLTGGNFKQCTTSNRSLAAKGAPVRRLWGKGKGRFRTRGRYSSGTVRGTSWITEDFCDGTRTRVFVGVVQVFDFVTKQTVAVKAGQSYFAKAGKVN